MAPLVLPALIVKKGLVKMGLPEVVIALAMVILQLIIQEPVKFVNRVIPILLIAPHVFVWMEPVIRLLATAFRVILDGLELIVMFAIMVIMDIIVPLAFNVEMADAMMAVLEMGLASAMKIGSLIQMELALSVNMDIMELIVSLRLPLQL
jgi:hypothetical protein